VGKVVALVLGTFDLLDPGGDVGVILQQIAQLARSGGKISRHISKEVEELGFAWKKAHHNGGEVS
jgi:hypothetical protein